MDEQSSCLINDAIAYQNYTPISILTILKPILKRRTAFACKNFPCESDGHLMEHEDFYKSMLDNTYEGIYFVDNERKISFWNKAAELITGYSSEDVIGKYCYNNILDHVDSTGNNLCMAGCPLHKTIEDGKSRAAEVYLRHKNGNRIPVSVRVIPLMENDKVVGAAELFVDATKKQEESKKVEKYKTLALRDQLTGLSNRRYIESFLESKLSEFMSFQIPFGVLFIDVDDFKNFTMTHMAMIPGMRFSKWLHRHVPD